ncbi:MAG: hypothetical protein RL458_717, partial [Pseudomonadota bacterium]
MGCQGGQGYGQYQDFRCRVDAERGDGGGAASA